MAHFSSSLCVAWFFGARHPIAMVLGLLGFVFVLWPRLWHFGPFTLVLGFAGSAWVRLLVGVGAQFREWCFWFCSRLQVVSPD